LMSSPLPHTTLTKFNLQSTSQMKAFLFDFLGLEPVKKTKSGGDSVDEEVINRLAEEQSVIFCELLRDHRKLSKALSTYLLGIHHCVTADGKIHPNFWMNTTETFRSSSSDPNFQNIPKHGDIVPGISWKIIRSLFTKRGPGWLLGEVDYEGAEVKVAAKLGNDITLINDLNNGLDMHSYWANIIFGLGFGMDELALVKAGHRDERYLAKNNFTFANIYGAIAESIARNMREFEFYQNFLRQQFEQTGRRKSEWDGWFKTRSENHMKECQDYFYSRYADFKTYQDHIIQRFDEVGYVETPLGFRRHHPLKKNEIINYPIQATSFHLLLDSLIRIERAMRERGFESELVGQIHDSAFFDLKVEEIPDVVLLVDDIMKNPRFEFWNTDPIVNLGTEWEIGHTWVNMQTFDRYTQVDDYNEAKAA
jgi:DNA polymerase-1